MSRESPHRVAVEIVGHEGPVDRGRGVLVHTVLRHVSDYADHFAPVIYAAGANSLAERAGGSGSGIGEISRARLSSTIATGS